MTTNLKLHILGAGQEVGRSSFILDCGEKFLLDRGVKLNPEKIEYPLPITTNLDAIIISHAHLDHVGDLPTVFNTLHALTYFTPCTLDISKILWYDTIKIATNNGDKPVFTKDEVTRTDRYAFPLNYKKRIQISKGTSLEFFDAGHISGSALSVMELPNKKRFLYTGDFNGNETRLYNKADFKSVGKVDYMVMESTYADRNHTPRKETEKMFVEDVLDVVEGGGHAVVASFAVGRSQEIIDILNEYKVSCPVYFDGMGQKAAAVMLRYPNQIRNPKFLKKSLQKAIWVKNPAMRKKALEQPCVIVTTSGMLQGGPVVSYLKSLYNDKKSKIFLTGYQVQGTPGRSVLDTGRMMLDGTEVEVAMKVQKYDFSAHASRDNLFDAIKICNPDKVVAVHGDAQVSQQFQEELKMMGIDAVAAKTGTTLDL